MERLKHFLLARFHVLFIMVMVTAVSLILLMIRLKLSQTYFLLFLVWNLFLAAIPFCISLYLSTKHTFPKYALVVWMGLWLLFLPNAPYMVTDLVHLRHENATFWLLDLILISSFAISGLLFYLLSVRDIHELLRSHLSGRASVVIIMLVPWLTGFGIYLGRFLRWNSWDVVQRPSALLRDIWEIIVHPMEHPLAVWVTFSFGIGLSVLNHVFKKYFLKNSKPSSTEPKGIL